MFATNEIRKYKFNKTAALNEITTYFSEYFKWLIGIKLKSKPAKNPQKVVPKVNTRMGIVFDPKRMAGSGNK